MIPFPITRRTLLRAMAVGGLVAASSRPGGTQPVAGAPLIAPIGWTGDVPGNGFRIGHGFACENTWFNPGWWHTGEDWYAADRDTGDALIYAVAPGEVVYAGFDYPGRVVIIRHADDLFSVYGHLDFDTPVGAGDRVGAGEEIGSVLLQVGGRAPSHLHFEARTFLTTSRVNGDYPSYGVSCGTNCPPGPGYWPIEAPEHPADMGWRNPTHLLARIALDGGVPEGLEVRMQSALGSDRTDIHVEPNSGSEVVDELALSPGGAFPLLDLSGGDPASTGTSASAYDYWLRIRTGEGTEGWVRGAVPSDRETGTDGRPSALDWPFLIVPAG